MIEDEGPKLVGVMMVVQVEMVMEVIMEMKVVVSWR